MLLNSIKEYYLSFPKNIIISHLWRCFLEKKHYSFSDLHNINEHSKISFFVIKGSGNEVDNSNYIKRGTVCIISQIWCIKGAQNDSGRYGTAKLEGKMYCHGCLC